MSIRVLMTVASIDSAMGGPSRSVCQLSNSLRQRDVDIEIITNEISNKFKNELQRSNKKNTLIHNNGIWLKINHFTSNAARQTGIPLIITPRGMLEPWALKYRRWRKLLAWILYQRRDLISATVIHATSVQEADNLQLLNLGLPIAVIPNGVQIPELYASFNAEKKKRTILFLSRIHPKKGLLNLVRAWSSLKNKDGWKLIIAGTSEDGHEEKIKNLVSELKISDSVEFIGPVSDNDKWSLYQSSDIFVLPTYSENFGIVVAEALSCGVPVITTKGAPWNELEKYKCGWWVDTGIEPLLTAIDKAISLSDEERTQMGIRGRRLIENNYNWNKVADQMIELYQWVLGNGDSPKTIYGNV